MVVRAKKRRPCRVARHGYLGTLYTIPHARMFLYSLRLHTPTAADITSYYTRSYYIRAVTASLLCYFTA